MEDIAAKRVYDDDGDATTVVIAAALGVVTVRVSGGRVGEFGIDHRCSPRDVAAVDGRVAVATEDDVLLGPPDDLAATGFGPAAAVGGDGAPIAAAPDGRVARLDDGWTERGSVDATVRAIDGDLLATGDGVYRLGDDLAYAGLDDVRDVAAAGPLAATDGGLYALGNGWMDVREGAFRVVAADGERAHAATSGALYERADGAWETVELPTEASVVDVDHGACPYAVTADGTLLADPGEWRAHPLGLGDAVGIAVV